MAKEDLQNTPCDLSYPKLHFFSNSQIEELRIERSDLKLERQLYFSYFIIFLKNKSNYKETILFL